MIRSHLLYKSIKKCEDLFNYNIYYHLPFIYNLDEDINLLNIPDIII